MKNFVCTVLFLIVAVSDSFGQLQLAIEPVVSGLTRPVKVTHASDDRLFVAEIGGKIKIVKNGAVLSQPFLDIGAKINDPDWAGIFSIAFPPDYQTSGFFYVLYVVKSKTEVQISRFSRQAGNADLADAGSEVKNPYDPLRGCARRGTGAEIWLLAKTVSCTFRQAIMARALAACRAIPTITPKIWVSFSVSCYGSTPVRRCLATTRSERYLHSA